MDGDRECHGTPPWTARIRPTSGLYGAHRLELVGDVAGDPDRRGDQRLVLVGRELEPVAARPDPRLPLAVYAELPLVADGEQHDVPLPLAEGAEPERDGCVAG